MHLHDEVKKTNHKDNQNQNNGKGMKLKPALKKPSLDEFHTTIEKLKQSKIDLNRNAKLNRIMNNHQPSPVIDTAVEPHKPKKHLRFNNQVEQRMINNVTDGRPEDDYRNRIFQYSALNEYLRSVAEEVESVEEEDDDELSSEQEDEDLDILGPSANERINSSRGIAVPDDDDDDEDDGIDPNKFKNLRRSYSLTHRRNSRHTMKSSMASTPKRKTKIETTVKLPPTTLKNCIDEDEDYDIYDGSGGMSDDNDSRFMISQQQQEFNTSQNMGYLDEDEDEEELSESSGRGISIAQSPNINPYNYMDTEDGVDIDLSLNGHGTPLRYVRLSTSSPAVTQYYPKDDEDDDDDDTTSSEEAARARLQDYTSMGSNQNGDEGRHRLYLDDGTPNDDSEVDTYPTPKSNSQRRIIFENNKIKVNNNPYSYTNGYGYQDEVLDETNLSSADLFGK